MKASCPYPLVESNRIAFGTILLCAAVAYGAIATAAASDTRVFHVRDFGAVADGRTESGAAIRAAISEAIAAGNSSERPVEIVFEAGTYLVQPDRPRTDCFPIRQATNLVVRGAGKATRIVINDPASAGCSFVLSRNVSVRDLSVDYDPVPFCQGTIRAVDVDGGWFELDVEPGYPTPDAENFIQAIEPYGKWGMIMDRTTRRIRSSTPDHFMTPRWEHRTDRVWRFFTADEHHRRNLAHMRVGDDYVHLARGHGSAVFAQGCDGIRIENVTVHTAPGLAVGLVGNRGEIVVRRLEVRFASHTTRLLTTNADGVHCQQNRAGPVIEECYFEGMADDAINIYAPPNVLREIRSPTQWLVTAGTTILAGDRLQVLDPRTGGLRGEVKAVEVTAEPRAFLLTLEAPLAGAVAGADHQSGDTVYNLDACGAGFQIRRNQMNGHRRYGCLLRAGGGVVEDNTFADTTGAGVVLTNEPDWPEGPVPWDIAIRRNRFIRGGTCLGYADSPQGAALVVRPARIGHRLAETEAIRDVVIEANTFEDRAGAAVFIGGATDVTLRRNRITAEPDAELRRRGPAILIERSSGVVLTDNTISDPRPGTTAAIEVGREVPPGTAGVSIANLEATLAPGAKLVLGIEDPVSSGAERSMVQPPNVNWVRAGINTNALRWGIQGRLLWGLPPASGKAPDGPRGLIRLFSPVLTNGGYDLLNFIAIEPVVAGVKGYSELEPSQLDDLAGKRLWAMPTDDPASDTRPLAAGQLTRLPNGVERLTVPVRVERFLSGAHVSLTVSQRSDAPDEIELAIQAEPDSAPIEYCILTATMGNKARTRHLWLKQERVSSLELYPDYRGPDFTPHRIFPLERLCLMPEGDILAAVTTDEADPAAAPAPPQARHWYYGGRPVTQYWRKPPGTWRSDLHVAVNARYTYWMSRHPIPGGISFENFELRERFHDGQQFNFGITRQSPADMGIQAVTSAGTSPPEAARGLIERLLPGHAGHFVLELIPPDPAGDVFEIETREGRVMLRGNNGVSLASALNWYLKYHCGCHHSMTGGSQLRLPDPLPEVAPKVRRVSSARHRYFWNYCCFGSE